MKEIKSNRLQLLSEKSNLFRLLKNQNSKYNYGLDMKFLLKQIDYGIKSMTYYEYTDEEKSFKEIISLNKKNNLTDEERIKLDELISKQREIYSEDELNNKINYLTECFSKHTSGQYISRTQSVEYTNYNDNIKSNSNMLKKLKIHELIHSITQGIYLGNKRIDMPSFVNNLSSKLNNKDFNLEDYTIISGYSTVKLNNNLECVDIKNNTFMEMCTETLAGILTEEKNTKEFESFNIPSKMSGYYWTNTPRDLLVTAIGDSDFFIDMLKEDSKERFEKLNSDVKKKYNSDIIEKFDGYLKNIASDQEEIKKEAIYNMEKDLCDVFVSRLSQDERSSDIKEQVDFFKENLTLKEFKDLDFENLAINRKDTFKNSLSDKVVSKEEAAIKSYNKENIEEKSEEKKDIEYERKI